MSAATDLSWMPVSGRHKVEIGSSLGRALKARKGTATLNKKIPDRNFHSCRYNFKPESIDPARPGTIETKKGKDSTSVTVERASTQPGESHVFVGNEQPAKEWECVLIYDEELGHFTLEKLDSYVQLNYDRRSSAISRRYSPLAAPEERPSTSTQVAELGSAAADAEGESVQDLFEEAASAVGPSKPLARREEEEEEEEEEEDGEMIEVAATTAAASASVPTPAPPPVASQRAPLKPKPQPPSQTSSQKQPPPPKATPSPIKGKGKRDIDTTLDSDVEEEVLTFGQPARPTKRSRPSAPPPPASQGLALSSSSTAALALPTSSTANPLPPGPTLDASDSEEEWEDIPAPPPPFVPAHQISQSQLTREEEEEGEEGEDGEEIDEDMFNLQMDEQLGNTPQEDPDDFLADALASQPDPLLSPSVPVTGPISLNAFVGGGLLDDDYSSTDEESDDDE